MIASKWIPAKSDQEFINIQMLMVDLVGCVLEIYKRRTATNTLLFLDLVPEQFPFPIQRIQTDRELEFFAEKVQLKIMEFGIKFRPNKPASPHINGKVERSQKQILKNFMQSQSYLTLKQ